jgi:hypothetical protein
MFERDEKVVQKHDIDVSGVAIQKANRPLHGPAGRVIRDKVIFEHDAAPRFRKCIDKMPPDSHVRIEASIDTSTVVFRKVRVDHASRAHSHAPELGVRVHQSVDAMRQINAVYGVRCVHSVCLIIPKKKQIRFLQNEDAGRMNETCDASFRRSFRKGSPRTVSRTFRPLSTCVFWLRVQGRCKERHDRTKRRISARILLV